MFKQYINHIITKWIDSNPFQLITRFLYRGEKFRCNLCERNYSKFLKAGYSKRENAVCPGCGSVESTRVLWFYLTNEVLGKKNKKEFLIVEPKRTLIRNLRKYDIDLDKCQLKYFNSRDNLKTENFQGGKYDVIIFAHIIQYLNDDVFALKELKRLLRPGGFVLIQTVINPEMDRKYEHITSNEDIDRLRKYYELGAISIYGANFVKYLEGIEFNVELIDYADQFGDAATAYYRLGDSSREKIFKCKKI